MKRQKGKHRAPKVKGRSMGWSASLLTLIVGVSVMVFPFAAKWATAIELAREGEEYTLIANQDSAEWFKKAVSANISGNYQGALEAVTIEGTEAIARLQIPSISVDLPVYPDSKDETLEKGAGHLEGSALPVGGSGTRSVITAHSGMPTKRMFDRLPKTEIGDQVYLTVLGQTLAYEITESVVDTPEDGVKHIQPEAGKDLLTLVTCTPYGVNTHRLLVTAKRAPGPLDGVVADVSTAGFPWWAIAYLAGLTAIGSIATQAKKRSAASQERTKEVTK